LYPRGGKLVAAIRRDQPVKVEVLARILDSA
jgi:hypothetical protein